MNVRECIDLSIARLVTRGELLGGEVIGYRSDGPPVFRAPSRAIARRLKASGLSHATWRGRRDLILNPSGRDLRGWS